MATPIVSFAIPTYNRSKYCISLIKSISKIPGNFEVVISDNSTDKKVFNFIAENKIDERILYKFTEEKLNMTQNLNRAISFSRGFYICCIGDDDTIMPNTFRYLEEFKKKGVEIISPVVTINYCWPDFSSIYFKYAHKSRIYYSFSKPYLKKKDAREAFESALENCFQGTDNMPKLYHGFVDRKILENINAKTGSYVFGSSPDVSASVLIALSSKNFYETNIPLTIPGASSLSNTGRAAKKKHFGELVNEDQTKDFIEFWPKKIPPVFTVETVWAHSSLVSMKMLKVENVQFNYIKLYSRLLLNNLRHFKYFLKYLKPLSLGEKLQLALEVVNYAVIKCFLFSKRALLPTASGGRNYFSKVINLEQVIETVGKIKPDKNFNFKECISLIQKLD